MSSLSRQYHPPSCSLEITAQLSPLSRWARRPMLKSVHFLLSFQELSGQNHEPLEVRGDREQLHLLSETVSDYVQSILGESLATSDWQSSAQFAVPLSDQGAAPSTRDRAAPPPQQPCLRTRGLVTHELVLGCLSTNAEHHTVPLKASQLFDLVSALEDCTAELEILPLSASPSRRPPLPIWASSAAVIVLMLGAATATLQLTRQTPSTTQDWVTSTERKDPSHPPAAAADGITATPAPTGRSTPKSTSPSSPPSTSSPALAPPVADVGSPTPRTPNSPLVATAPQPKGPAPTTVPPAPSKPLAKADPQVLPTQPQNRPKDQGPVANQLPQGQQPAPAASAEAAADQASVPTQVPNRRNTVQSTAPPQPMAEAEPNDANTSLEADSLDKAARRERQKQSARYPETRNQVGRPAPANTNFSPTATSQALEVRRYMSQLWQAPAGLTQSLPYQLTLNANGSLQRIQPLNQAATQYLAQVPFPAVNQPFITPLKSSQSPHVRLVLKPDGTVQAFVDAPSGAAK